MSLSLERKIILGFVASMAVMLLVSGASIWNVRWLGDTFYWVNHTQSVLNRLEETLTDILSMQTSTRGFVLTGSDDILRPYQTGAARMTGQFDDLRTLVADNPRQLDRLREAQQAARQAQTIMQDRIESRRIRGLDAVRETPEFLRGQEAVESFRGLIETMKQEERRLLGDRFVHAGQASRTTVATIIVASGLALGFISLGAWIVSRDFMRRREAEAERDRFFDVTRDLLCIAGYDGYFKRVNPAWEATLGHSGQELRAKSFIEFVHPEDRDRTAAEAARVAQGAETVAFENRYRCQDGSYRWLAWSARAVPDKQLIVASARDITERKASDDRIRRLNTDLEAHARQLEATNRELEAFSYSVSHDLRAPLRHIDGFANLLAKRAESALDLESRRFIGAISRSAKQMGTLIDDLLGFSRIGRVPLRLQPVNQDELVADVIAGGHYETASRLIRWEIGPLPKIQGDYGLLRQVWANLIDNAVKYSSKVAQPRIEVGGRADEEKQAYVFFVRDNGAGFDMAYADKLFGVFQRLHSPTDFEGTGIGLANVRRIVTRHGGHTWAEARVNAGATFYFSLPIEPPTPAPGSAPPFKSSPHD